MTKLELAYIEKELDIQLPEEYKKEALEEKLVQTRYQDYFLNDVKQIVSANKRLRRLGMGGTAWKKNHYIFGYNRNKIGYKGFYYMDVSSNDAAVYYTERNKQWKYSPNDMNYNKFGRLSPISEFISFYLASEARRRKYENMPVVELTDEEKRVKREAFFAELWKSKGEQGKE